jgi:hypothetical protein
MILFGQLFAFIFFALLMLLAILAWVEEDLNQPPPFLRGPDDEGEEDDEEGCSCLK